MGTTHFLLVMLPTVLAMLNQRYALGLDIADMPAPSEPRH